jgi:hypothetical protein
MGVLTMKRFVSIIGILVLAMMAASPVNSADFLSGARGGGMGFSYFVLADDPAGALYNPSALAFIKGWQTQFMYEKLNSYDYRAISEKPYFGQFGVTYFRPGIGTFAVNSLQSGSFAKQTAIPTVNHVAFSYGREVSPYWSVGGSVKYLTEMGFGKRSAFDMDLSVSLRTNYSIAASLALENITRATLSPTYRNTEEHLPRRSRLGAGYFFTGSQDLQGALMLAAQLEESGVGQKMTTSLVNFGTEWWFMQNRQLSIGARTGYTLGQAVRNNIKSDYTGPTAGLSLNHKIGQSDIRLDYAWQAFPFTTSDGSTPANHYLSVTFGWGGVPTYPSQNRTERTPKPSKVVEKKDIVKPQIFKSQNIEDVEAPKVDKDTDFQNSDVKTFNVQMEVSDISSMDLKRIVFYVRPQQVVKTTSWKLYVFKAKIKTWNDDEANRWALRVIEGKGVPPINIIWDGLDTKGELVSTGKYYFLMTAIDIKGDHYATDWFNFKLE